jgi:hypothetical protein
MLARKCYPEQLLAVDTWQGNVDEDELHVSVELAKKRDVYGTFLSNMQLLTNGNVQALRQDCHDFLAGFSEPIKFCHIDASHDYASVKRTIEALLPKLVPGAVICGDDLLNAPGVRQAVQELLPGVIPIKNFWWWKNRL